MASIHICTLKTDESQYALMKNSFLRAGFDETQCSYRVFDNSHGNQHDPYAVISQQMQDAEELRQEDRPRWVIFCHQDVEVNSGQSLSGLVAALDELEKLDPLWAVAGNGGRTARLETVRHIADPFGESFAGPTPRRTLTLDENFIIVRVGAGLRCSAQVGGFHLYATDLCLHALVKGRSVYVVDFRLTHHSKGTVDERFYAVQRRLQGVWNRRFLGVLAASPVNTFGLSRFAPVRRLLNSGRFTNYAAAHPWISDSLLKINKWFF